MGEPRGTDWVDTRPAFLKIAAELRAKIMSGDLVGDFPSVAQIVNKYPTNSTTVAQRAIKMLKAEGFIDPPKQGARTRIRAERLRPVVATAEADTASVRYRLLFVGDVQAEPGIGVQQTDPLPADAADALGARAALLRKQVGTLKSNGVPLELVWNFYPLEIAGTTQLAENRLISGGAKAVLAALGHTAVERVDDTTGRAPTEEEVQLLHLPEDIPVLRMLRSVLDQNGTPIEVSVIVKAAHLYAQRHRSKIF